ncbi:protein PIN-LIKES 3-like isoform X2 [Ricinus communis]|uniref:protein PIN-LIKES 3-like isoform X2 n=1 Tax=Ricinus communis TaxID=3988 RepID=UPI00201AC0A8|nr:protein PIN-LIKES 3-like isoform X2 [Ricinus communis]
MWFMPVNILITFIIGSALGWILIKITAPPKHLKGLILGCCAAGNMGNLVLIIVPAMCREKGSPFGPPDVCHAYGISYASLSMAIGAIYMWSYVYNMMRISASEINKEVRRKDTEGTPESMNSGNLLPSKELPISAELTYGLLHPGTESDKIVKTFTWTQVSNKIKQHLRMISEKLNLKAIFAPSTIGAIVGFIVGAVPQIRELLIGTNAPLHVIEDSASLVGDAAIPAVTLIVGGNLLRGLKGSGIQLSLVFGILGVRYVILPLLGIVIVRGAVHFGLVGSDPLYQFILLVQFAVPPAMNIGTMTQLFGTGQSECSVIMLWTYAMASISLTLWSTLFLWMVT